MKRNILKLLSVALALVMILSMVPMMAMAEEAHEHNDVCACSADVAPAAVICTHTYTFVGSYNTYSCPVPGGHTVERYDQYKCQLCGYTYSEFVKTYFSVHNWTTAADSNTVYCAYCGYVK